MTSLQFVEQIGLRFQNEIRAYFMLYEGYLLSQQFHWEFQNLWLYLRSTLCTLIGSLCGISDDISTSTLEYKFKLNR